LSKKMEYTGENEREFPRFGVFKPGDEVEYDETLFNTGLFRVIKEKKKDKEGDE
jgi:hypothetical protein